jgi:hypothetical protein
MKVILGDEFGVLKCIDTGKKQLESKFYEIKKNNNTVGISNLFSDQRHILGVLHEKQFDILNWNNKKVLHNLSIQGNDKSSYISQVIKHTIDFSSVVLASNDNKLNILRFNDECAFISSDEVDLSTKHLQKISNSTVTQDIFCLFKDTPVSIFDLEKRSITWKAKNLPNDELDLRVPIYDVDIAQAKDNANVFYTATGHGEIRKYDRKVKNRPVQDKQIYNRKINRMVLTDDQNYLIVGDTVGNIFMLDHRKSNYLYITYRL